MKYIPKLSASLLAVVLMLFGFDSAAVEEDSLVGVGGYDLVSYQNGKKPLPGNGNHVVRHKDVNYLFANKSNAKKFKANAEKYLPAYGGYCAYGASVGKKFIGDPTVWEIVDGQLYLNLDNSIKSIWVKDIPGNIKKADIQWERIKDISASKL